MNKTHNQSILRILFIPYTVLFILAFTAFTGYYVYTETKDIKENIFISISNNITNVSRSIDSLTAGLDTTSQNIIYSNLIKENFTSYIDYTLTFPQANNSQYSNLQNTKILSDLLVSIIGPNSFVDQVTLYDLTSGAFKVGLDTSESLDSVQNKDWYEKTLSLSGSKNIYSDADFSLSKYFSYSGGEHFLALSRLYYSPLNIPQGIVEVKKSFTAIDSIINGITYTFNEQLIIFSEDNKILYPYQSSNAYYTYTNLVNNSDIPFQKINNVLQKFYNSKKQYVLYTTSNYSGLTTAVIVNQKQLVSPIIHYILTNGLILFLACLAIIIISYFISKRIYTPLNQIHAQVKDFPNDLTNSYSSNFQPITTNITELSSLYNALLIMQKQIRTSLKNELHLQNKEAQSKMLALHSQMNPHFLYNSLATIQAMSEENMNDAIIAMCQNISRMLRYISADSDNNLVTLIDEITHTQDYLECMKIRYEDDLNYDITIPEEMFNCKIPKLSVQPLIENSIKFCTKSSPPWNLSIKGTLNSKHWKLEIKDNGPGFSNDILTSLNLKLAEINKTGVLPNLEINGMGLLNIYIRYKMIYKNNHIFHIDNLTPTGAIITIGGDLA